MANDIEYALLVTKYGENCLTTMHPPRVHLFGIAVLHGVIHKNTFSLIFMFPYQCVL